MELGIQPSMLRSWRGRQRADRGSALAATLGRPGATASMVSVEQAEIRRLRKELERAQMERDILKKAVGIFSCPPR
jgi:transposase